MLVPCSIPKSFLFQSFLKVSPQSPVLCFDNEIHYSFTVLKADYPWDVQCAARRGRRRRHRSCALSRASQPHFRMVWRRTFRRFSRKGGRSQFLSTDLLAKTSCSPQKEAFTHQPEYTVTPHACLLPACLPYSCLPACPICLPLPYRRSHTYIEASWAKLYALCSYAK